MADYLETRRSAGGYVRIIYVEPYDKQRMSDHVHGELKAAAGREIVKGEPQEEEWKNMAVDIFNYSTLGGGGRRGGGEDEMAN